MSGYVLQRIEDKKFVTPPGSKHSYTKQLQHALIFKTAEDARDGKCDNETVIPIEDLLNQPEP